MAYLKLDKQKLDLIVMVGPKEKYNPTKQIEKAHELCLSTKKDLKGFIKDNWNTEDVKKVEEIFNKNPSEKIKFEEYLEKTYLPKMEELIKEVNIINKKFQEKILDN